jgi:myo-inositol-1(or 4)-monophosphatase
MMLATSRSALATAAAAESTTPHVPPPPPLRRRQRRAADRVAARANRIPNAQLLEVAKLAARKGAEVVAAAADAPRRVMSKGEAFDVVTETDAAAEKAVAGAILAAFPDHPILGEEGGILGNADAVSKSEWLWVVDPLDGTCNFAHALPSFSVSVAVLRHATPVAGVVIEFTGGPGNWSTREYAASRNGGATVDGKALQCSRVSKLREAVVACEMVWYGSTRPQDDAENDWARAVWPENARLLAELVREVRGLRCSGSAAVNLARVASGQCDAYFQYNLKPWDVAAGVLLVEEAGGRVATADGTAYSVFDRSLLAANDAVFEALLEKTEPRTAAIQALGVKLGPAGVPAGYSVRSGRQME